MYKQKKETSLEESRGIGSWIKRRIILIIAAFMFGMSNAMYDEDKIIRGKQTYIEQEYQKDKENTLHNN